MKQEGEKNLGSKKILNGVLVIIAGIIQGIGLLAYFLSKDIRVAVICTVVAIGLGGLVLANTTTEEKIEINDERNVYIRRKAVSSASNITILIEIFVAFILMFLGEKEIATLIFGFVLINSFLTAMFLKRYEKRF
ncbi:hypothetical protein [uncultured Clostridium sp.]|uniref:hypothetical protein n=1 Tax=uncultured Clostridium sp. TaxID=59620 RepID=UPI00262B9406|nr:hypothetical protein [uncultured Clostridium sp.]